MVPINITSRIAAITATGFDNATRVSFTIYPLPLVLIGYVRFRPDYQLRVRKYGRRYPIVSRRKSTGKPVKLSVWNNIKNPLIVIAAVVLVLLLSSLGLPCNRPPWGVIAGINLESGEIVWRKTLGSTADVAPGPVSGWGCRHWAGRSLRPVT
jgi:hypothetical protein